MLLASSFPTLPLALLSLVALAPAVLAGSQLYPDGLSPHIEAGWSNLKYAQYTMPAPATTFPAHCNANDGGCPAPAKIVGYEIACVDLPVDRTDSQL